MTMTWNELTADSTTSNIINSVIVNKTLPTQSESLSAIFNNAMGIAVTNFSAFDNPYSEPTHVISLQYVTKIKIFDSVAHFNKTLSKMNTQRMIQIALLNGVTIDQIWKNADCVREYLIIRLMGRANAYMVEAPGYAYTKFFVRAAYNRAAWNNDKATCDAIEYVYENGHNKKGRKSTISNRQRETLCNAHRNGATVKDLMTASPYMGFKDELQYNFIVGALKAGKVYKCEEHIANASLLN